MTRIATATLTSFALFGPPAALAQAGPTQTLWLCGLSDDAVRLVCVADADPRQTVPAEPAQRVVVNGTVFPLDPKREYTVDLWSPPTDWENVERLARATICYRSPGCSVLVTGERWAAYVPPARVVSRVGVAR